MTLRLYSLVARARALGNNDDLASLETERQTLAERLARTTRLYQAKLAEQIGFRGDLDFLMKWEGDVGGVKLLGGAVVIDPATYLAHETPEVIRARYEFILTPAELQAVLAVTGKSGAAAEAAYAANPILTRIRIERADVARLVPEILEKWWRGLVDTYPILGAPDTPGAVQTAILSLRVNIGSAKRYWDTLAPLIRGGKWLELADAIEAVSAGANFPNMFPAIRKRRSEEAALIRNALTPASSATTGSEFFGKGGHREY